MTDLLTIKRAVHTSCLTAQSHAARAARWSAGHPLTSLGLLYGTLIYLGLAALINVPGRALIALMIVASAAWWCVGRYGARAQPRTPKLRFFTGDNGPLRLSEDIGSSRIVYCVGVRNEGTTIADSVRVNIDDVEGFALPASDVSLPIFRSAESSVSLQPDESEYFCIVRRMNGASDPDGAVVLCCHDDLVAASFGIQELATGRTIALSAYSEGAPRTTTEIQISSKREPDAAWSLNIQLLGGADEGAMLAPDQGLIAATPPQAREAWNRARAKLSQLGERSFAQLRKTISAGGTSERRELSQEPSERRATPDERIAPAMSAVEGAWLDKSPKIDVVVKAAPAQSDRLQRLLARQARAQMSKA